MTYLRFCAAALVLSANGCGLISSDVTNFDLTLPDKKFSLDTGSWQVSQTAANALLTTPCTSDQVCNSAVTTACSMGCAGMCAMNTCELLLNVAVHQPVDLVMEKPELKTINDQPVINVTIDSVQYEVTQNTLNVDTPPMTVYVSPMSVMDPKDPTAKAIGTIDPVTAGMTFPPREMTYTPEGKQALIDIMSTFKTPFNVLVGATLTVSSASMLPSGKLDAVVHIKAHAGI
jgi:hypothetical protein